MWRFSLRLDTDVVYFRYVLQSVLSSCVRYRSVCERMLIQDVKY